jgi:hypothetical protein
MNEAPTIEWRARRSRLIGPLVIHLLAAVAVVDVALRWPVAWPLLSLVAASAAYDLARGWRDSSRVRRLSCTPFGVTVDGVDCEIRDAWLAIGWTVLRLRLRRGRTQLLYVHKSEIPSPQFAALRRHVKSLAYR